MQFFHFWLEITFLGKLGPKNQKWKFGPWTNSNMQNSMVVFILFVVDSEYSLWGNLVPKLKIVSLSRNVGPMLIRIRKIQWWLFIFFVSYQNSPFWANLVEKIKTVSLGRNLLHRLIWICRIQLWCSLFQFYTRNKLFWQIWSNKSKLSVSAESSYQDYVSMFHTKMI